MHLTLHVLFAVLCAAIAVYLVSISGCSFSPAMYFDGPVRLHIEQEDTDAGTDL